VDIAKGGGSSRNETSQARKRPKGFPTGRNAISSQLVYQFPIITSGSKIPSSKIPSFMPFYALCPTHPFAAIIPEDLNAASIPPEPSLYVDLLFSSPNPSPAS